MIARIISDWLAHLRKKRAARIIAQAERERSAVVRSKQIRRRKHMRSSHLDGLLQEATHRSLAASVGKTWRGA